MRKNILIIFLFFLLVSCSSLTSISTRQPAKLSESTGTSTVIVAPQSTPTNSPIPVDTITPLPTWTSLPTVSPELGMKILNMWIEGTDDCHLPCWGGITPGKTSWQEAQQLLGPIDGFLSLKTSLNDECAFGKCNGIGWSLFPETLADGGIYTKFPENTVHLIIINIQDAGTKKISLLKNVKLEKILSLYGTPSILLLSTEPDLPGDIFLELTLIYPERQSIIRYSRHAKIDGENVVSCGPDSYVKLIILDNKEQLRSLDSIAVALETKDLHVDSWHKSIEEVTSMTIESFYEIFRKPNATCIVTPLKDWVP